MTLDNETEMDLLRKMGVMWTLFSAGSRHGRVFTVSTLMEVRNGRGFKDRKEVDAFLRWALREKLVQEVNDEYRFADDARDVYWFYMDGEEIPSDDAELSTETRAKADAIAARVAVRRRQEEARKKVNGQPDPSYRYGLKGFSKDPRNCVIIVRFMYDRWGTSPVEKGELFSAFAETFEWKDNLGVLMGRMLYGMDLYIHRTGGLYAGHTVLYQVRDRGLKLIGVIPDEDEE